jgi:hypothetical protein
MEGFDNEPQAVSHQRNIHDRAVPHGEGTGRLAGFKGTIPDGPFLPYWESLKAYRCPSWSRRSRRPSVNIQLLPNFRFVFMKEDRVILRRQPLVLLGSVMVAGIFLCTPFSHVRAQVGPSNLVSQSPAGVEIKTDACVLAIRPINPSAMRVRCAKEGAAETPSIVLLKQSSVPAFKVLEDAATVVVATSKMQAVFDRHSGALHFTDHAGEAFLSEIPGTRRLAQSTVQGEPTFAVEEDFTSPPGEHLFGSGEFQDGFLDIRDLLRRLTQVNSQIAIPFLLSSKGYGILWHSYGLTDLNPADERVLLTPSSMGKETTADVTTSEGTRREVRREGDFAGSIEVPRSGRYVFMLDVGQKMARRYHVAIDEIQAILAPMAITTNV